MQDPVLTLLVAERLTLKYLQDIMLPDFRPVMYLLSLVFLVLKEADVELFGICSRYLSPPGGSEDDLVHMSMFLLSTYITW